MKPVIPNEVADAIEWFRRAFGANNAEAILRPVIDTENYNGDMTVKLRAIPFDTLLAALVNGYEREKTAEQLAEEDRAARYERIRMVYEEKCELIFSAAASGFADGIHWTLNTLGIEIEGVNA